MPASYFHASGKGRLPDVLAFCVIHAQTGIASPTFDAVSVKPAPPPTVEVRNHINTGGPELPTAAASIGGAFRWSAS